ncbi:MAG TPA: acetate--CoA ligase family protein [Acidobacteriota bacterium]|nr:acetate--CoA ligase family protein [Acidobacteriota bacterium]
MLEAFFTPRGVAVIGASADPLKLGHGVVRNLVESRYRGGIYPVNPKAGEILGLQCYPSVSEVPEPLDLAVVVIPAEQVIAAVEECGERGIRHAIIISGGFREIGPEGLRREEELSRKASRYGMRIIGPNCIGTIDTHCPLNSTFVTGTPRPGGIGFLSQSGALCAAVIDWARASGVGYSRIVSLGNQVDVHDAEVLETFASDARTRVIAAYLEGVREGLHFMRAIERAARKKPVVVLKAGRAEGAAQAVASHTGALAGSAEAYEAAFRQSGALSADSIEELFDWARALAWQPLPSGNRVAVLTNAGGPAILAVDLFEPAGLQLAPLSSHTRDYLKARLPAAASVANPVDVLAGSGPGTYGVALDALLSDPAVDAALVIQAPQNWFLPTSLAEVVSEVAASHRKPVLASMMGLASVDEALRILHRRHIPNFAFPERAVSALKAMRTRRLWLDTEPEAPAHLQASDPQAASRALEESDFPALLAAYDIPLAQTRPASDGQEAVQEAKAIGFPVALKLRAREVSHKSDVGGVVLGLESEAEVREAFDQIMESARDARPGLEIQGVWVQKMISGGQEILTGVRRDPQFGVLVVAGRGGLEVELLRDISTAVAPLSRRQAREMLETTRAGVRLKGWRHLPPADIEAAVDVILRLSQIALDCPQIEELEINPLAVLPQGQGCVALDVRGRISSQSPTADG